MWALTILITLALTTAIAEAFSPEHRRGKRALVVMLPGASSFRNHAKFGEPEYQPLLTALAVRHVAVFDPLPALLTVLGQRSYCQHYSRPADCNGHLGVYVSELMPSTVMAELRWRGLVK